ncbi:IDEAL domain-containing protein [Brevibacillus formosus]|uniref:IDEAL domain-containing protein n=1 Tax=Brevibacillus formosus TaxID=54913 RepID=A0A837KMR0_9BACL|nr:IDEAL domain-containing protein [Brevibacillus formosus]KLH98473.1 hypothetical protein AA984_15845 [Brevibacillus formosus]MED1960467.1 IDEAL domain-containing protein [Brevibacillus formosus]PSJ89529.1 IDEAL domain-containing protein [Brevibacillus formosus]GED60640.1 hypothetical protein BFO01nite_47720 [Brevibacillus formosus]
MNRDELLEVGEWVLGKTKFGELVQGFVETDDSLRGTAKVYVVQCDNEETIGKLVVIPRQWMERIPVGSFDDEEHMHDLIDLALATKDREWFMDLTAKASTMRQTSGKEARKTRSSSIRNRLGTSAIWEQ